MQDENEEAAQAAPSLIRLFDYGFDVVFPRLPVCRNDTSIHRLSVHGQVNRALDALTRCRAAGIPVAERVAERGWATAAGVIAGSGMALEVAVFDRQGGLLATTGFRKV